MSVDKNDYYGKDVAEAIKKACEELGVPQENLDIEVVETGSTGIFGLIRKKARIRAGIKIAADEQTAYIEPDSVAGSEEETTEPLMEETNPVEVPASSATVTDDDEEEDEEILGEAEQEDDASPESVEIVRAELLQIIELMGFPSAIEVETAGLAVTCTLRGDFEENLAGPEGKVLDSLQYILRKIVSRKVPERLRITINVGTFREKRLEELKIKAAELASLVKLDGKTQVLPGLNPSERRVIHMFFQEDKEIRSRSVGDGLFKKILIYKPGKGNRPGGRKRPQGKGRQGKNGSKQNRES
ncbi:MAG: Jag N-terminal domain-containing protein [Desulforhopalus sp.]|nr:Jag N-terminal domain-containing protein [Desulforhopalus sp.]